MHSHGARRIYRSDKLPQASNEEGGERPPAIRKASDHFERKAPSQTKASYLINNHPHTTPSPGKITATFPLPPPSSSCSSSFLANSSRVALNSIFYSNLEIRRQNIPFNFQTKATARILDAIDNAIDNPDEYLNLISALHKSNVIHLPTDPPYQNDRDLTMQFLRGIFIGHFNSDHVALAPKTYPRSTTAYLRWCHYLPLFLSSALIDKFNVNFTNPIIDAINNKPANQPIPRNHCRTSDYPKLLTRIHKGGLLACRIDSDTQTPLSRYAPFL